MENLANFIAVGFVLHFCWSYYRNCYRKGFTMDVWHFSLLFNLILIHVMLPFNRSDLNIFALGALLKGAQAHVTEAYLISAFGYAGILLGGNLWRVNLGLGLRSYFSQLVELPSRGSLLLLRSRSLLIAHGLVAVSLIAGVLLYYFRLEGFGFNLRGLLLVMPALRPIAQFAAFYSVLIGSYCMARFYQFKERSMLVILVMILVGLLFFGERGNIIAVVSMSVLVLFIRMGRRLKLVWLAAGSFGAVAFIFLLDALRQPNFSVNAIIAGFAVNLLYGNSFSDTRDFAVILANWNGRYYYGLTYLAGIIAFVPRFLSSFRDTWSIGVVTATVVGFKPTEHPGLRAGIFGEAFLNFGLPGVLLLSLFIGATIRLVDLRMKQAAAVLPRPDMRIFSYYVITILIAVAENSSAASTMYSILLIFLVSWVMLRSARFLNLAID